MTSFEGLHADDHAIIKFAHKMREKMRFAREERGRGGWTVMSAEELSAMLRGHVEKGDPVDVANFCMMLSANGASIAPVEGVSGLKRCGWNSEDQIVEPMDDGEYVFHSEAAAIIAATKWERDKDIRAWRNSFDLMHRRAMEAETKLAQIEKPEAGK